jgi:hypothetical protein
MRAAASPIQGSSGGAAQNMANQPLSAAKVLRTDFHAGSTRLGYVARHECALDV